MSVPNRAATRPGTTRRVRLKDYDYSTSGYYFVTICTHNRLHYFGSITDARLSLTPAGIMAARSIEDCPSQLASVCIDSFVVMPNHIHVLIGISVRVENESQSDNLIAVVHWLKSTTHQRYREGVRKHDWKPFEGMVWQEGYHDHIVRNDQELETLRAYIATNVERWGEDRFYDGFVDWR